MQAYQRLVFFRFLRNALIAAAILAALLVAVRLLWGWQARSRFAAARSKIESAHFPVDLAAFQQRPIPDARNGALVLLQALKARNIDHPEFGARGGDPPRGFFYGRMFWGGLDGPRSREVIARNKETLALLGQAAQMPDAQWPANSLVDQQIPDAARPADDDFYMGLYEIRWLLRAAAEAAHNNHRDAEAFADVEQMLGLSRIVGAYPTLAAQTIAESMRSEAAQTMERWMPDLNFGGDQALPIRQVMDALVNSTPPSGRIAHAFEYETIAYQNTCQQVVPSLTQWWIRPLLTDALARRLDAQFALLPVAQVQNWQQLVKIPVPHAAEHTNLDTIVFSLSEPAVDVVETVRYHFRSQTDTEAVAMLVAAHLERAQTGQYPKSLQQIVPNYLAKAPVDPFASDGRPLRYRLDKGGPTVWSVGEDGKDDDASFASATMTGPGSGTGLAGGTPGGRRGGRYGLGLAGPTAGAWGRGFGGLGGFGGGMFGFGRRYVQPDIVYGAAWRDEVNSLMMMR